MTRQEFVNTAVHWAGCKESDGSFRQIIDVYNSIYPLPAGYRMQYSDPWCAAYVSAVAQNAGCTDIVFPECGCDRMIALYRRAGRWVEDDAHVPSPGDIIFYDWDDNGIGDNMGSSDHVGIVVEVEGSMILVIEGNMSDAVGYRRLTVNAKCIRGFGVPAFEETDAQASDADGEDEPAPTVWKMPEEKMAVSVWLLKRGMGGNCVKMLQRCLGITDDGLFGEDTEETVKLFQAKNGLLVDGEVGSETWGCLLN